MREVSEMGRSRAKKPTLDQKKVIARDGLNPRDWLVLRNMEYSMILVHRSSGESRIVVK